ncbi:nitrous oxide reductase family maturation protein NosD [Umezawaea sp. NPDC059074]|uniref:right-handed parallel beta-helix repeat-containing protein n=1 Tax=Umezawaea sp. NPDC059074 TaxID=3346716 RepID=UPI0036CD4B98
MNSPHLASTTGTRPVRRLDTARRRATVLVAAASLLAGPMTGQALAAPPPSAQCGDVVTTDIKLTADLQCSGPGLVVKAGGIVLNLNGHSITGSGTATGISVIGQANVRVRNGTLSRFGRGVFLATSVDGELLNVTLADNTTDNVQTVDNSTNLKLTNCKIRRGRVQINTSSGLTVANTEFSGVGLELVSSSRSPVISGSTFTDSSVTYSTNANNGSLTRSTFTRSGISLREADDLTVSGNVFTQGYIRVLNACRNTTIADNRFSNGDRAVFVQQPASSTNLRITGNKFTRNQIGVDASDTFTGLEDGITISENTFTENAVAGILLESTVNQSPYWVRIEGNTLRSNGQTSGGRVDSAGRPVNDGIHVTVPAGAPVEITGNITRTNADYGIEAVPGSVTDGGGNTSVGNPSGCLGVTCA